MASAYTPGLKVTRSTRIVKERRLPLLGEVLVEKGQRVEAHDLVAKTMLPGEPTTINIAQRFNYDVSMVEEIQLIKDLMKVQPGDKVKEGDVLAEKPGFLGIKFLATTVTSPVEGVVDSLSEITGQLIIRKPPVPIQMEAYIPGTVIDVIPEEGVLVENQAALVQGIFGIGGERYGEIKTVVANPHDVLDASKIDESCKDKVIVGGSLVTLDAMRKAEEVGVLGVVVGGIIDTDLVEYLGYDIGVAITGTEDIPLSLILTEGFGEIRMADKTFDMLKELNGQMASINGATQIRAGVLRPEIIVENVGEEVHTTEAAQKEQTGLKDGTLIRIIRAPYFGKLATVTELPPELQEVESETMVRVLFAKLESGEVVRVPRANVELIEE